MWNAMKSGAQRVGVKLSAAGTALVLPIVARADAAAAVAEIEAAETAALTVAGGLLAMGVAVWGGLYLYRKFFK